MSIVSGFHQEIHQVREDGVYELKDIANMDQTPLPFVLNDGKTYDDTGATEIWCASAASGLDKRQCTVQLTAFADGVPCATTSDFSWTRQAHREKGE